MRIPAVRGLIRRRLLVNFRADPRVVERILPAPFRPKLHAGHAIVGICLIRLEGIHLAGTPAALGLSSENAAHRIAVRWVDDDDEEREGVFIPRRDTDSLMSRLAGGRIFPGEHHAADFDVTDAGGAIDLSMRSRDGTVAVRVTGREADALPATSCFRSLADSSAYFEGGSVGYSATRDLCRYDGLRLETESWHVRPLGVTAVESSFFDDRTRFPAGSITFDHALVMRDLPHSWHAVPDLSTQEESTS